MHKFGIADIEQPALRLGGDATHRFDDLGSRRRPTLTPNLSATAPNLFLVFRRAPGAHMGAPRIDEGRAGQR